MRAGHHHRKSWSSDCEHGSDHGSCTPTAEPTEKALQQVADQYDFCVVDNAPDINISVINALTAANDVLIPVEVDDNTLEGMNELLDQIQEVKEELNRTCRTSAAL